MKIILLVVVSWFASGTIKCIINFIKTKKFSLLFLEYGGFPSAHNAMVSSVLFYNIYNFGLEDSSIGPMMVLLIITAADSFSLRRIIDRHSVHLNKLNHLEKRHKTRIRHTLIEILGGMCIGFITAYSIYNIN